MANLRDLGLSEYEARAYQALLQTGPTTAKGLSQVSEVPMGRIYDVLNSLEQYSLIRSQTASRPKKYAAVEPETALDRLLADKKRSLAEKEAQYEEIVTELVQSLDSNESDETFWTAAVGPDEVIDLLIERIAAADSRVVMVASSVSSESDLDSLGERVAETLEQAIERGIQASLLMPPELVDALPESVGERYRTDLFPHENFECRTSEDVSGTFTIVDDIETCIEVAHPLRTADTFAMINLKDRYFAENVRDEFEPRWKRARPLVL